MEPDDSAPGRDGLEGGNARAEVLQVIGATADELGRMRASRSAELREVRARAGEESPGVQAGRG
ncbi:hypothetical protein [Jiangella ureilytica]|uniref:hypothetical protein n=1 Tax=Jiangella ureilytica TaxID=2530374 RepID=UPI001052F3E4|nr:hypothetical protein [Jiangella ureilytica]